MTSTKKTVFISAAVVIALAAGIFFSGRGFRCTRTVIGVGFVRGAGMVTLKNKYAGFVSKVNFLTGAKVKKGDVILEYDDLEWRTKLENARNAVIEQEDIVAIKKLALQLKTIDPIPSEYRNMINRHRAAQAKAARLQHEREVYAKLYAKRIVSDLSYREKTQASQDADYDVLSRAHDIEIVRSGMEPLYIEMAKRDLAAAEVRLANLKRQLELIEEDGKYYKIVSPGEGIVETNSDTLFAYNPAATAAAELHDFSQGTKVYCLLDERDIGYITVGKEYRFRTNLFDCEKKGFPIIRPYKVKKDHSSFGDRSLYMIQCMLVSTPEPLTLNSTGQLEVEVPCKR